MRRLQQLVQACIVSTIVSLVGCAPAGPEMNSGEPSALLSQEPSQQQQAHSLSQTDASAYWRLAGMTLNEKLGQMIQGELFDVLESIDGGLNPLTELNLGSVLSGGGSIIDDNSPRGWQKVYDKLQRAAVASSSGIPIIYGIDAVHGHNAMVGATLFPHNVGLGAARDPSLMMRVGAVTAREVVATGMDWTFGPAVSVGRDERWGRSYESFGEHPHLQRLLAKPYVLGLQGGTTRGTHIVATAKHFIGDGGTVWGTGFPRILPDWTPIEGEYGIDRGDTQEDFERLVELHGQGFIRAIEARVGSIMVSFSSVNGTKMHESKRLIADFLKAAPHHGGLGFEGFVLSDWNGIDDIPTDETDPIAAYKEQIAKSINAGADMLMVAGRLEWTEDIADQLDPDSEGERVVDDMFRFERVVQLLGEAVREGRVDQSRIDDAVWRILRVKYQAGLFHKFDRFGRPRHHVRRLRQWLAGKVGSEQHRAIAREAVRKSLVLLKNDDNTLPLTPEAYDTILVAGKNADDFGAQNGGWTFSWQGSRGNDNLAAGDRTVLAGLVQVADQHGLNVVYEENGCFGKTAMPDRSVAVVVIGESPYAEFLGDTDDLSLDPTDLATLERIYELGVPTVVVMVSGRPMLVETELANWDALIAAWLPGSQGEGIAEVLFGEYDFTGRLPVTWPRDMSQIPINHGDGQQGLFDYGYGLNYRCTGP